MTSILYFKVLKYLVEYFQISSMNPLNNKETLNWKAQEKNIKKFERNPLAVNIIIW